MELLVNIDQIIQRLSKKYEIVVGFPADKQVVYPPDDRKGHHNKGGQTVAQVATWNEFGTKSKKGNQHIPSRPFLREALRKNRPQIKNLIVQSFSLKNLQDETYFDKLGLKLVDMVRDSIRNGDWVPNADRTKLQKLKWPTRQKWARGRLKDFEEIAQEYHKQKPLIDRGIMIKSVNYEVRSS